MLGRGSGRKEAIMIIGVVSDVHGALSEEAAAALEGCDMILCAGDVERASVLMELEAIAPTIAVLGNCDHSLSGMNVPFTASPRIAGVRFFMVHRPEDIGRPADDVKVVVHGHTHIPREDRIDDVLYLNPGSPTRPRGGSKKSLARLVVDAGEVRATEFVTVG